MGKRRNRYSSSLAADWVGSSPSTEKVATIDFPADTRLIHEVPSFKPESLHQSSKSTNSAPEAVDARKRARYKELIPAEWIFSSSENDPATESPQLRPLPGSRSSMPNDARLYDPSVETTSGRRQATSLFITPTLRRNPLPLQQDNRAMPPPAPTKDMKMILPSIHAQQERLNPPKDSSLDSQSRAGQESHAAIGPSKPLRETTVSPPSTITTDSPSYGCDLPARVPTISPNYSIR